MNVYAKQIGDGVITSIRPTKYKSSQVNGETNYEVVMEAKTEDGKTQMLKSLIVHRPSGQYEFRNYTKYNEGADGSPNQAGDGYKAISEADDLWKHFTD